MTIDEREQAQLEAMFRRREGDVGASGGAVPPALRSRVRRREARTTVRTVATAAVVVVGLVLASTWFDRRPPAPADGDVPARSADVLGVVVDAPAGWTLLELGPLPDQPPTVGDSNVTPIFQLTNFEPELPGRVVFPTCELGEDPVVLYVRLGVPDGIPVDEIPEEPVLRPSRAAPGFDCDVPTRTASWLSGYYLEAWLLGEDSPDLRTAEAILRNLEPGWIPDSYFASFGTPDIRDWKGRAVQGPLTVLDSGGVGAQTWDLVAYHERYPASPGRLCVSVQVNQVLLPPVCDMDIALNGGDFGTTDGLETTSVAVRSGQETVRYTYGGLAPAEATTTVDLRSGELLANRVVRLPEFLGAPIAATVTITSAEAEGRIVDVGEDGTEGAGQSINAPSLEVDVPDVGPGTPEARVGTVDAFGKTWTAWADDHRDSMLLRAPSGLACTNSSPSVSVDEVSTPARGTLWAFACARGPVDTVTTTAVMEDGTRIDGVVFPPPPELDDPRPLVVVPLEGTQARSGTLSLYGADGELLAERRF
jgi:hypothetical protein